MPIKGHIGSGLQGWMGKLGITPDEIAALASMDTSDVRGGVVEEDLAEVAFERDELVEACRTSLDMLASIAVPTVFQHCFPPILVAAWQLLTDSALSTVKLFPQIALGIPRGHAKTTLIKLYALFCILFTKKKFILVLCDTSKNAENIIADVADMLSEANIVALFGDWRIGREIDRQDLKKFAFRGRTVTIGALGAGGSIRGLNVKHTRPDVMIFEDVQTKENSESPVQSQALERWMIGTAMKAKSPGGCTFIFVGNMYPGSNSILKKLKNNPTWTKFISGAILADGTALWPELHSIKDLIAELDNDISMGHPEIFFSEVLNDTEAGINTRTDLSKIRDWEFTELDKPQGKFIIIDPSSNKKGGDAVTIGYFEVYDAIPACVELYEENMSPGNTIRRSLLMALTHGVRLIAVESTSYQYTLLYWFNEICGQLGITGVECVDVYSGAYSKNSRITDTLKELTSGELLLHPSVRSQVVHQITNWNPLKRDNDDGILDVLSYGRKVVELYAPAIMCDDSILMIEGESVSVPEFNSPF